MNEFLLHAMRTGARHVGRRRADWSSPSHTVAPADVEEEEATPPRAFPPGVAELSVHDPEQVREAPSAPALPPATPVAGHGTADAGRIESTGPAQYDLSGDQARSRGPGDDDSTATTAERLGRPVEDGVIEPPQLRVGRGRPETLTPPVMEPSEQPKLRQTVADKGTGDAVGDGNRESPSEPGAPGGTTRVPLPPPGVASLFPVTSIPGLHTAGDDLAPATHRWVMAPPRDGNARAGAPLPSGTSVPAPSTGDRDDAVADTAPQPLGAETSWPPSVATSLPVPPPMAWTTPVAADPPHASKEETELVIEHLEVRVEGQRQPPPAAERVHPSADNGPSGAWDPAVRRYLKRI